MDLAELRPEEIKSREIVGWLNGSPCYAIETTGGFTMILCLRNGRLEPLAYSPHDRITAAIVKKREPTMKWVQLNKSEAEVDSALVRRYEQLTMHLRASRGFRD